MNEEEKFDDLINSKLSERDFPFDELNWDEAERLIIRQQKWSTIRKFSLVFSAGLIAGAAIMIPFITGNHSTIPNVVITKQDIQHNSVDQNTTLQQNNTDQDKATDNKNIEKSSPSVPTAFVKKNSGTDEHSSPKSLSSTSKVSNGRLSLLAKGEGWKTKSKKKQHSASVVVASVDNTGKKHKPIQTHSNDRVVDQTVNNNAVNTPEQNTSQPVVISDNKNNKKIADNVLSPAPENNNSAQVNNPPQVNSSTQLNNKAENKNNTSATPASGKITTSNTETSKVSKPATIDTSHISPPMLPGTTPNFGPYTANIISAYAGVNYAFGWNNTDGKEASGVTPMGGIEYAHFFSKKVALSAGVGYAELTKLNKTYSSSITQYDFGANATITSVTPKTIYYLSIPVEFQYHFTEKLSANLGLNYLWMLTTSSTLNSYNENYLGQQSNMTSKTQNGYTQGFSNYDFQLILTGTYMFTERFGISAQYYNGLVYIENNSFPGVNQYERNSGFRLFLSYQLVK